MSIDYSEIYFHNIYEVELDSSKTLFFSLSHLTYHPLFERQFAIITAANPQNHLLSHAENAARNGKLYSALYKKHTLLPALGCLKGHCEAGYLICDIDLDDALNVARKFDQYALFYCDKKSLRYIRCSDAAVIVERRVGVKPID